MNERALKNIKKLDALIAKTVSRAGAILQANPDCSASFLTAVGSVDVLVRSRNALLDRQPSSSCRSQA